MTATLDRTVADPTSATVPSSSEPAAAADDLSWWAQIREDIAAARRRDPAATSAAVTVVSSAGLHAIWLHRLAHAQWRRGGWRKMLARVIAYLSRAWTGVEIHPAAQIGRRFFIDHGMGVVIGETAVVGDDCMLYHGVTLGGTASARVKRHPTLEDGVLVGSGAKILGPVTLGAGSKVGANAVVLHDVPPGAVATGVPATIHHPRHQRPAEVLYADPALFI